MNNNSQNYENKSEEGSDVRQCELIEDERNHCEIEKLKFIFCIKISHVLT